MYWPTRPTLLILAVASAAAACRPPVVHTPAPAQASRPPFYWANQILPCPSPEADEAQPIYDETEVATPVTLAISVGANYPTALRDRGVTGEVALAFVVNPMGCAEAASLQVVREAAPAFVAAARAAVLRTRFQPARRDGRLVRQRVTMPFSFLIQR